MRNGELPLPRVSETLGSKIIKVSPDDGSIEIQFEGKEEFTNPIGCIQGGLLAAMLDDTLGPAIGCTLKENEFALTLELKTQFIAPAKQGILLGYGRLCPG